MIAPIAMDRSGTPPPDAALAGFLASETEAEAGERLGELLAGTASPLVWRVLRRQLGGRRSGVPEEDLEDLHAGALLRLQVQLASVRAGERDPMASFADYVAVTTYNAAAAYLMARRPERTRLRQRVRYVLGKDARLALWSDATHDTLCGLVAWKGRGAGEDARGLAELAGEAVAELGREAARFAAVVGAVIGRRGAPCRFEDLVDALAAALDVHDEPAGSFGDRPAGRDPATEAVAPEPSAEDRLGDRQILGRLWGEILELPDRQRSALLLNLRDEGGGDLLSTLLGCGVASPAGVAAALGLEPAELAALLPDLPLEDLRIAERLGLTRQQVINLRKSARLRLGRRMRGILPGMAG